MERAVVCRDLQRAYPKAACTGMNTTISVMLHGSLQANSLQQLVSSHFEHVEKMASRFLPESELSQLNKTPPGDALPVSAPFFSLLQKAWAMAAKTDFLFQPFVGTALKQWGYDRSFELLDTDAAPRAIPAATDVAKTSASVFPGVAPDDPQALLFAQERLTVCKRCALELDLGGIGKGWAVDSLYKRVHAAADTHEGIIDAGGDLFVWSNRHPWTVGIQHPRQEEKELFQLCVQQAGIATSNTLRRRWYHNGIACHHILDGRTFTPSESDVLQATVLAPSTTEAEVAAKVICMLPSEDAGIWIKNHFPHFGYIIVLANGDVKLNRQVMAYAERMIG